MRDLDLSQNPIRALEIYSFYQRTLGTKAIATLASLSIDR